MSLQLRPAARADWAMLYAWRNDPASRGAGPDSRMVTIHEHLAWLTMALANPEHHRVYIARDPMHGHVGVARVQSADCAAKVSIVVDAAHRGRGYAGTMLQLLEQEVRSGWPWATRLEAEVRVDNFHSLRLFAMCGYDLTGLDGPLVTMTKELTDGTHAGTGDAPAARGAGGGGAEPAAGRRRRGRPAHRQADPGERREPGDPDPSEA